LYVVMSVAGARQRRQSGRQTIVIDAGSKADADIAKLTTARR
jgi:hypothetical protein